MSDHVPMGANVTELLDLAKRARKHAQDFATHQVGESLLAFAEELEARAKALMDGGASDGDCFGPEEPV